MIYRYLLADLATNKVPTDALFSRHGLDTEKPFTDEFIAQVGSLNNYETETETETFYDAPSSPDEAPNDLPETPPSSTQDSLQTLLEHNSLSRLWTLMLREFATTMPLGDQSIGHVLKAEYRDQADGSILGIKTFVYDDEVLQAYLGDELSWWKGEREARGVVVEEAYKCRMCEFAGECEWRKGKIEEALRAHRERAGARSVV